MKGFPSVMAILHNGCICMPPEVKELFELDTDTCKCCKKEINNGDLVFSKVFLYGCSASKSELHYSICTFHGTCGLLFEEKGTRLVGEKGLWYSFPNKTKKKEYDLLKVLSKYYYGIRNHPPLDMCICCGASAINRPMKSCGKCLTVMYCNEECQNKHWPEHKTGCKYFKEWI